MPLAAVWPCGAAPELLWVPVPVPAACPACAGSPALGDSPFFARRRCRCRGAGLRARAGACGGVAGAPGSAMPLPALRFITNDNTLPLFSAFHPQGCRGTLLLTSCYVRYL